VKTRPSATLKEHGKVLGVSPTAVWKRLRRMSITLKKNT
jgi:DNA-binding Lrp family transcriptional regulator